MYQGVSDSGRAWDSGRVEALVAALATLGGPAADCADGGPEDAELLAQLRALENLKAAAAGAQARVTAVFADGQERAAQVAREAAKDQGFDAWRAARDRFRGSHSTAAQVGFARRLSPWQGARAVGFAQRLVSDLPATAAALCAGVLSEHRAMIVDRETSHLSVSDRIAVDEQVCADQQALTRLGDRALEHAVRAAGYRRDPQGAVDRARTAEAERRVTIRPLPDVMCRVSALLPMAQGIAAYAVLCQEADAARATGDPRGRGQILADTLVERVTGQASATAVPVEVQVVLSDAALLGTGPDADGPGLVPGFGPVPAGWVRDLIGATPPQGASKDTKATQVFLRRLYSTPDGTELVAMESRRRVFPAGLRRFLTTRDGTCRTPWCDAPIRHTDHVRDHTRGGPTSVSNGEGLCERCNHTKQLPGWSVAVLDPPGDGSGRPHRVRWSTPTGATYDSTAPPLLPTNTPRPYESSVRNRIESSRAS